MVYLSLPWWYWFPYSLLNLCLFFPSQFPYIIRSASASFHLVKNKFHVFILYHQLPSLLAPSTNSWVRSPTPISLRIVLCSLLIFLTLTGILNIGDLNIHLDKLSSILASHFLMGRDAFKSLHKLPSQQGLPWSQYLKPQPRATLVHPITSPYFSPFIALITFQCKIKLMHLFCSFNSPTESMLCEYSDICVLFITMGSQCLEQYLEYHR